MKIVVILVSGLLLSYATFAKVVKFQVDMSEQTVSALGVHIGGDFQTLAGYGGDWESSTTQMTQQGNTGIYSVYVNIPAFRVYLFKYINGDQWYECEFVPVESRVDNPNDDSRWIYIDSLTNDTFVVPAVLFSGNAPMGKKLLRFSVDMMDATSISNNGIHVAGDFQTTLSPISHRMANLKNSIYDLIVYVDSTATYSYIYFNGNTLASIETVPTSCATNNYRMLTILNDTVLPTICFSSCNACISGIKNESYEIPVSIFPNPAQKSCTITIGELGEIYQIALLDINGKSLKNFQNINSQEIVIEKENLQAGVYFLKITDSKSSITRKLIFE